MSVLDDLKGKNIEINGVGYPDRKVLKITATGATATDEPANNATHLDFTSLVQSQLSIYKPESYGALGDGVTDDTTAIQAAIDAAEAAGGGTVLLAAANYPVTGLTVDSPNVEILGRHNARLTFTPTSGNAINVTAANCRLSGFTVVQSGTPVSGAHFRMSSGATNGKILNCVSDGGYWGAEVADSGVEVNGLTVKDSVSIGVKDVVSSNCVYRGITITNAGGDGIEIAGDYHTISNINIDGAVDGIHFTTASLGCSLSGAFITGCSNDGVYLQGGECSVTGVVSRSNTGAGIELGIGADKNSVCGNTCQGNTGTGITIGTTGVTGNVVKSNALEGNGVDLSIPTLTIATGAVTVPAAIDGVWTLDTEAAAAADDLDTVNGAISGHLYSFRSANSARDPTVKDGTGNLSTAGDFLLSDPADRITLQGDGSGTLFEVSRSDNA